MKNELEKFIREHISFSVESVGFPNLNITKLASAILKDYVKKEELLGKIDKAVFQVMFEKKEYINLPDSYVKEICRKAIEKIIEEA